MRNLNIHKKRWPLLALLPYLCLSGCISGPVIVAGVAGTGAANSAGSSVPIEQQYTDLGIRSKIYTILNNTKGLNGANVEVTVFNGIVLLLGQVPSAAIRQSIATQASALQGVTIVYNQLRVGPNEPFTQFTNDSWITSKVLTNLTTAKGVNPLHFKVVTQADIVYLMGQVTAAEGDAATKVAAQTSGVKQVIQIFNIVPPATDTKTNVVPAGGAGSNNNASAPIVKTPASAAKPASVAPANSGDHIPEYAPDYGAVENGQPGPAVSD